MITGNLEDIREKAVLDDKILSKLEFLKGDFSQYTAGRYEVEKNKR